REPRRRNGAGTARPVWNVGGFLQWRNRPRGRKEFSPLFTRLARIVREETNLVPGKTAVGNNSRLLLSGGTPCSPPECLQRNQDPKSTAPRRREDRADDDVAVAAAADVAGRAGPMPP